MEFLKTQLEQIRQHLGKLSTSARLASVLLAVVVALSLAWIITVAASPERVAVVDAPMTGEELIRAEKAIRQQGVDVEVSNDDGDSWVLIEQVTNLTGGWVEREVHLTDYIALTGQMKLRFSAMDNPNDSIDEGGVDAVYIFDSPCE